MEFICKKCGRILTKESIDTMRFVPARDPDTDEFDCKLVCMPCFEDYANNTNGHPLSVRSWWGENEDKD